MVNSPFFSLIYNVTVFVLLFFQEFTEVVIPFLNEYAKEVISLFFFQDAINKQCFLIFYEVTSNFITFLIKF